MPTKCSWVIHGSLTSERKASTSPSSFINHSTLLLNRALKRQAPGLVFTCMHFEVRGLDRLRTRRRVGSTHRRGNHMHDHSRFQRDINDVTGISLFLSLFYSQKSLTHNIGSASVLPIIQVESKYKEMRQATLETGGRESVKKGEGGWASWTAQALFAWTRTNDEPGKSETCGYIAAGLLRSGVTFGHRAPARFWTVDAKASVACSMPASVYSHIARKRKFSTLSLRSAVENGSY